MFEFPTTEMTLKRKRDSCEGLEEAEPNAKKQLCWPEMGMEQQVCGQGWWPSHPAQSLQPPSVLSDPSWLPCPSQLPSHMQAEAMELEEQPAQETPNNNNNSGGGSVSGTPASQPCLQCMAGQPGHLLHITEPQPAAPSRPLPPTNESISFASHFVPFSLDSLLM